MATYSKTLKDIFFHKSNVITKEIGVLDSHRRGIKILYSYDPEEKSQGIQFINKNRLKASINLQDPKKNILMIVEILRSILSNGNTNFSAPGSIGFFPRLLFILLGRKILNVSQTFGESEFSLDLEIAAGTSVTCYQFIKVAGWYRECIFLVEQAYSKRASIFNQKYSGSKNYPSIDWLKLFPGECEEFITMISSFKLSLI